MLFDLLEVDSEPIVDEPLRERRRRLEQVVGDGAGVFVSPQFDDGPALLAAAREQELEGVVAKRATSPYRSGRRSTDWHKLKLRQTQEVVIAGYTRGQGRRAGFGALVAGVHDAGVLRWAGNVGTGFSDDEIERLRKLLAPLERSDSPLPRLEDAPRSRRTSCVEPKLVAEWSSPSGPTRTARAPSYLAYRRQGGTGRARRERSPLPRAEAWSPDSSSLESTSRSGPTRASRRGDHRVLPRRRRVLVRTAAGRSR
jgi:bifunctional non-homologous end joining protein LigD